MPVQRELMKYKGKKGREEREEGDERERLGDLYIEQPRSQFLHSDHTMSHIPHDEIERTSRDEALVSGVVLLLSAEVPGHEGDAA